MEVSFHREIESLKLGAGQVFHGEGILAVTKALLQSGVSYVGGYQGSPISHLLDVMVQARPYLDELGVHVEACTNEASAAAMLAASIMYPVRGAVTWKSVVGTNVAADALSNLASPGVLGGAVVIVGEDYGEGASVIQERTHAFAMKSAMWLLDPRPDLPSLVRRVQQAFALSEASSTPVMVELRIRSCHLQGSFVAGDNVAPAISSRRPLQEPSPFSYDRLSHPPSTFRQEKLKYDVRMPAARRYIVESELNERLDGDGADLRELGLIVQGGLTNTLLRALAEAGLATADGRPRVALLVLNCVYPLVPEQIAAFCEGRRAVLVVEEGQPDYIEQDVAATLRRAGVATPLHGKDLLSMGGEYTAEVLLAGVAGLLDRYRPAPEAAPARAALAAMDALRAAARHKLRRPVPARPPNFCTGCPERPVFAALKLAEQQVGRVHVSADIGCHSFATFEPFSFGHSILGYGMSMASSAAVKNFSARRPLAIMGDGGFWHNGLLSGVSSTLLNGGDGVLLIMKNGYTSATGTQEMISTPRSESRRVAEGASATGDELTIEKTLRGMGVKWLRTVHNYRVAKVRDTLREALTSPFGGLKVIVAEGECQLERQRRLRPLRAAKLQRGERVVRTRYGVDESTCTGDHSCIRLSGCPTLTVKTAADPLKRSPVAHVQNECVGCGLCGEVAQAAVLCPSFWRADVISNPCGWDRAVDRVNRTVIAWMQPDFLPLPLAGEGRREGAARPGDNGAASAAPPSPQPSPASGRGRNTRVLIAALGGEGGGVLAGWLVRCARDAGVPVQATSVPGVAQRTGSTSYYVEWQPKQTNGTPMFALQPTAGRVDVLVASELLEAGRMMERGFVGDGTTLIASTHRVYTTLEKMAPADGRYDGDAVLDAGHALAQRCIAFDMGRVAREHGTAVSAVMFGAMAGAGVLPWPCAACEEVIRDGGGAADASLRGFAAGFDAACGEAPAPAAVPPRPDDPFASLDAALLSRVHALPAAMQSTVARGLLRCLDFQGPAYAERLLREAETLSATAARDLERIAVAEDAVRSLALWMCFEDVIRVADLKTRRSRFDDVRAEVQWRPGQVLRITEMLVPGVEEVAAILPRRLGAAVQRAAQRRGWVGRLQASLPLRSTSAWGYGLLRLLAALKPLRPHSLRQHEEDTAIAAWLDAMHRMLPRSTAYAAALARLPDVLKGYGDTHRRGRQHYAALWQAHVAGALAEDADAAALNARAAAFDAGLRAASTLPPAGMAGSAPPVVTPQPMRFFRTRPGTPPG